MGQFKPMVKMETTEPSIELKLKKGGSVKSPTKMKTGDTGTGHKKMADGGGALSAIAGTPALVGRPAVNAPVRSPGRPPMSARRKAMMARPARPTAPMKDGGESKAEHKAEMKKMGSLEKEIKSHASKPASKAHKGLKTGGVALGQGGYKKGGGVIPESVSARGGEKYKNTEMHTAEYTGKSSGKTGGVKEGNAGGYATGGVALGQGGYKAGGKAKKAYAAGGTVDSGHPVAMPQGRKKPSSPVSINQLAGTFKKGGKVTPAEGRLQKINKSENAPAMKAAKAQSNEIYSKYQKMAEGGIPSDIEDQIKTSRNEKAYRNWEKSEKEENEALRDFIPSLGRKAMEGIKGLFGATPKGSGSVTETEKSVTVTPGKKRGGRAK